LNSAFKDKSRLTTGPHLWGGFSTNRIMLITLATLLIPAAGGVYQYGEQALWVIVVCIVACYAADILCRKLRGQPLRPDMGTPITALLLALSLPPGLPLWIAALGSFFGICIVKEAFGGLGQNIFNPALGARAFLLASFAAPMTRWIEPGGFGADAITTASPLAGGTAAEPGGLELYQALLFGDAPGVIASGALFLMVGGLILVILRIVDFRAPVAYIVSVALIALAFGEDPAFHVLAGGVIFGAFFFITDPVTTPVHWPGRVIFAVGAGVLTMLIRLLGAAPDGVTYAILIMNALTPLIDRYIKPGPMGAKEVKSGPA